MIFKVSFVLLTKNDRATSNASYISDWSNGIWIQNERD